jgi:hypothetical protein
MRRIASAAFSFVGRLDSMSDSELYVCRSDVVSCALGDSVTLLDMRSEKYFTLNETGAVVWDRAQSPCTLVDLCDAIAQTYSIDGQAARADVEALVGRLVDAGLMHVLASDHV